VNNAFFLADEDEECYVIPPEEWTAVHGEGYLWMLKKQLYGRRKAAQKFVDTVAAIMVKLRFSRCEIMPCYFFNEHRDVSCEIHMDDFYATGPQEQVDEFLEELKAEMSIKVSGPFGVGDRYRHLKRDRIITDEGIIVKAADEHYVKLAKLLNLERGKTKSNPTTGKLLVEDTSKELEGSHKTLFRSATGILLYMAVDRPDCQYAIKLLAQKMAKPTETAMEELKHLVRYALGTRHYGILIRRKLHGLTVEALKPHSDSDWAGNKVHRRSTTCVHIMWNGSLLASFVRTQCAVSLSSSEAEFYALVAAVIEGMYFQAILAFFGVSLKLIGYTDSAGARGMVAREGVGKVRHLACRTLWIQQAVKSKAVEIRPVAGKENHADLGTKVLLGPHVRKMCGLVNMVEDESGAIVGGGDSETVRRVETASSDAFVCELLRRLLARSIV
jgi:hypothetical protein